METDGHNTFSNQGFLSLDLSHQAWYVRAKSFDNQPGIPVSLYISNAINDVVKDFSIIQPQFWAFFVEAHATRRGWLSTEFFY